MALIFLSSCQSSNNAPSSSPSRASSEPASTTQRAREPLYNGDGGRGIVIAVPTPAMQNSTRADNWMPQLFQDLITGDMARFSAMTIIDRSNEQMVLAEQTLSLSGNYSDDDYIRIGNLTNAQFIVTGNIQNVSGRYNVSFRINDTETNEIKASFNKPYSINDIESGLAAKEAVLELLFGLGIELTETGERTLLTVQPVEVRATTNLAKGMAAENNNNHVEALAYFIEAVNIAPTMREASQRIQNFGGSFQTDSIHARAEYARQQAQRWEKIFRDLRTYLDDNLAMVVYDFSTIEDTITTSGTRMVVRLRISPGVKVVANRTVLQVWKTVKDNWTEIVNDRENRSWITADLRALAGRVDNTLREMTWQYYVNVGLFDEYGDMIATSQVRLGPNFRYTPSFQVLAQHRYYVDRNYEAVTFQHIPVERITSEITPRIIEIGTLSRDNPNFSSKLQPPIMSVPEWQEWLSLQGGAR
jgi:TolB-like protein